MVTRKPQAFLAAATLITSVSSLGFSCDDVVASKVRWNLKELGGPRQVPWLQDGEPSNSDFVFSLDICKPLRKHRGENPHDECPMNTRVCGVQYKTNKYDNTTITDRVVAIAGDYHLTHGLPLESEVYRMKDSDSNSDSDKEGVRVVLSGGKDPMGDKSGKKQKAIIEFICDPSTDGKDTEVDERPEDPDDKDGDKKEGEKARRDDDGGEEKEKEKSLRFLSYEDEKVKGEEWGVLRLEWNTKYACEGAVDAPKDPSEVGGHWGFFTWMIIILFLATSAYLIFGSWLNYNRYGARGWDALPHGDTLRDLPYIMTDFGRKVTSTIQGGGSRGGYSAV